jgi:anionic cell wall polymer biosynthesis LytR-Cps2A-Psr (LCP) family protein
MSPRGSRLAVAACLVSVATLLAGAGGGRSASAPETTGGSAATGTSGAAAVSAWVADDLMPALDSGLPLRELLERLTSAGSAAPPVSYGKDGRLTVLLMGSDYRWWASGERIDVMLVMSIDPRTKRVAAASIPRDTVFFPRAPSNGGGTSGTARVNAMYGGYKRSSFGHRGVDPRALERFTDDVAYVLGTEIDYYAMIRFVGFEGLVDSVHGLSVDIAAPITDPHYPSAGRGGIYFPKASGYHLDGNPPCHPAPRMCHSALAYARSRKGMVGARPSNDWVRARRQQELVMAGATRIVDSVGVAGLAALLAVDRDRIFTNVPKTLPAASQLLSLVSGASLIPFRSAVFGPDSFEYATPQTPLYTYRLRLGRVRAWIAKHFYPIP